MAKNPRRTEADETVSSAQNSESTPAMSTRNVGDIGSGGGDGTDAASGQSEASLGDGDQPQEEQAKVSRSIIGTKYRDRYKGGGDWLSQQINGIIGKGEGSSQKMFELGRANGLNLDKFEDQRTRKNFPGRFRMTARNMLATVIKRRHGFTDLEGNFIEADKEWLTKVKAPASPVENRDGSAIVRPPTATAAAASPELAGTGAGASA